MKKFRHYIERLLLMVAALAMVACNVDELNVIEPEPEVGKEGYLVLSSVKINTDNETVDLGKNDITREGMPTTMDIPNPNNIVENTDNYWIEVYSVATDGTETIVDINSANETDNGILYGDLKNLQKQTAQGQTTAGIPLEPGSYVLKAYKTKNKEYDIQGVIADVSGVQPDATPRAYYMGEKAFTVESGKAVPVNVECKLANILTTVELAADLRKWFKPKTVDGVIGKDVTTTVTIKPAKEGVTGTANYVFPYDSNHGVEDNDGKVTSGGPFVYFKDFAAAADSTDGNTLTIELEGTYFTGSEGEMEGGTANDKWIPVSMKKTLTDVRAAQWRQISINIDRKTTGDVKFEITINSYVYDDDIEVDVVTMSQSLSLGQEEEVEDVGTENPNAPSVAIDHDEDGVGDGDLTYTITESMFNALGKPNKNLTVIITPATGSTVAEVWAVVNGTEALNSALTETGFTDGRVNLYPTNAVSDYCEFLTGGTLAQLSDDAMKELKNYPGEHTVSVYTKDSEGRQKHTDIIIKVEGSGTAPVITGPVDFEGNFFYDENDTPPTIHQLTATNKGSFKCAAEINSEGAGFTSFDVSVFIPDIGSLVKGALGGKLNTETGVVTVSLTGPYDDLTPASNVTTLKQLGLLPSDKDNLMGAESAIFDVTALMQLLYEAAEGECSFTVSVGNAYGTTTKTIKINVVK